MRLSDVISHMKLTSFPEIGLVIFLIVFAAIVWRVYLRRGARALESFKSLPLDDDMPAAHTNSSSNSPHSSRDILP